MRVRPDVVSSYHHHAMELVRVVMQRAEGHLYPYLLPEDGSKRNRLIAGFSGKGGSPATSLDLRASRSVSAYLQREWPDLEDETRPQLSSEEHRELISTHEGAVVLVSDEIDGTDLAEVVHASWATVHVFFEYRHTTARWEMLAGAIGTSDGGLYSFTNDSVYAGTWRTEDDQVAAGPSIKADMVAGDNHDPNAKPRSLLKVAAVAGNPERRKKLAEDFDLSDMWLLTTAGNPIIGGLLQGRLGAVIDVKGQKLRDIAYLIPFQACGGMLVTYPDWAPFTVLDLFAKHVADEEWISGDARCPPYVAATTMDKLALLQSRYKSR